MTCMIIILQCDYFSVCDFSFDAAGGTELVEQEDEHLLFISPLDCGQKNKRTQQTAE